jgi:protein MpaA
MKNCYKNYSESVKHVLAKNVKLMNSAKYCEIYKCLGIFLRVLTFFMVLSCCLIFLPKNFAIGAFTSDIVSVTPSEAAVKVSPDQVVEIVFTDRPKGDLERLFTIEPEIEGEVEIEDNIFRFIPSENYDYGVEYTVKFSSYPKCLAYIGNSADCSGENIYWSSKFRVEAHRIERIGTSVQGRNIYVDLFGSGDQQIFFVSALHGSEPVTIDIMEKWISHLDDNQEIIPEDKTLAIVKRANPDGIVYGTRWNARHVDLNRNWPTADWQPHSWWGSYYCTWCGGAYRASEPETRALLNMYRNRGADAIFAYHAAGDLVVPGETSHNQSVNWALDYANLSGIAYGSGGWTAYPITGDMNVWAVEELDIPSVLIENPSATNDYFEDHLPALLNVLQY